ncbi:hypothetical protein ABK040_003231 [Willaertia magna]
MSSGSSVDKKETVSICVLGDSSVGKTSLILKFKSGEFNEEYVQRQYNGNYIIYKYEKNTIYLLIYDTIGLEEFSQINKNFVKVADIYLICFSLNDIYSFKNINRYIKQLETTHLQTNKNLSEKIIFLVGCKSDTVNMDSLQKVTNSKNNTNLNVIKENVGKGISTSTANNNNNNLNGDLQRKLASLEKGLKKTFDGSYKAGTISSGGMGFARKRLDDEVDLAREEKKLIKALPTRPILPKPTVPIHPTRNNDTGSTVSTNNSNNNDSSIISPRVKPFHTRNRSYSSGSCSSQHSDNIDEDINETANSNSANNENKGETKFVTSEQIAQLLATNKVLSGYVECSSKEGKNIQQVFYESLKAYYKRIHTNKLKKFKSKKNRVDDECRLM